MKNSAPGPDPIYRHIFAQLSERIRRVDLAAGAQLPSERRLAEDARVSRMTARAAIGLLVQRGLVERRERAGVYVSRPKLEQVLSSTAGLSAQLRRRGVVPGARVVSRRALRAGEAAPEVGAALALGPVENVYQGVRLRTGDGEPLALETSYFPARLLPGSLEHDLAGSVYEVMARRYDLRPARTRQELEPTGLDADAAALLGTRPDLPALRLVRAAWSADGVAFEYARDLHRADRLRFVVETPAR